MREAIISTKSVAITPDKSAIEVVATVDEGSVSAGMYLHVPLNRSTDITVMISAVKPAADGQVRLILDCGDDPEGADMIHALNFADETLLAREAVEE